MGKKKIILFFIIIGFFLFSFYFICNSNYLLKSEDTTPCLFIGTDSPIIIDGNQELNDSSDSGFGNSTHPFIIENKIIDAGTAHGISIENIDVFFIVNNCSIRNGGWGIILNNVTNGQIDNCTIQGSSRLGSTGIGLWDSNNSKILRNHIENRRSSGIYLYITINCTVQENYVQFCESGYDFTGNHNCTIIGNTANYNLNYGFYFVNHWNSTINSNIADYNEDGMYFSGAWNCNVNENTIRHNNDAGIELSSSSNNTITWNVLLWNNEGIKLSKYFLNSENYISNNYIINRVAPLIVISLIVIIIIGILLLISSLVYYYFRKRKKVHKIKFGKNQILSSFKRKIELDEKLELNSETPIDNGSTEINIMKKLKISLIEKIFLSVLVSQHEKTSETTLTFQRGNKLTKGEKILILVYSGLWITTFILQLIGSVIYFHESQVFNFSTDVSFIILFINLCFFCFLLVFFPFCTLKLPIDHYRFEMQMKKQMQDLKHPIIKKNRMTPKRLRQIFLSLIIIGLSISIISIFIGFLEPSFNNYPWFAQELDAPPLIFSTIIIFQGIITLIGLTLIIFYKKDMILILGCLICLMSGILFLFGGYTIMNIQDLDIRFLLSPSIFLWMFLGLMSILISVIALSKSPALKEDSHTHKNIASEVKA